MVGEAKSNTRRKLYILIAVAALALYSILCFAVNPVSDSMRADIAYDESILPVLLDYVGTVVDLAAIVFSYAVLIYGVYKFGLGYLKFGVVVFGLCVMYKYSSLAIVAWVNNGSIPIDWHTYVMDIVFYTILETLQLLIVLWISNRHIKTFREKNIYMRSVGGEEMSVYPFHKFYDKTNVLMRSAMISAVVVFVSKIAGVFVNDIVLIIMDGLPSSLNTLIAMGLFYLQNILFALICGVLCYIAVVFTIMKLIERFDEKVQ